MQRVLLLLALAACGGREPSRRAPAAQPALPASPPPLTHDAYVWQRAWTGSVRAAVAGAPSELAGLRVLTLEVGRDGTAVWPAVDPASLVRAARPITAVVRLDGSRPPAGLSLTPVLARLDAWRSAGVTVAGLEIDHDCATAGLAGYAAWLAAARPPRAATPRFSITALPTWTGSPALRRVAAAVDELVVQVHAVRAPRLFDEAEARRWLEAFAAAVPDAALRVALPTYEVDRRGQTLAAEPDEVGDLLRSLEQRPIAGVTGVVWFRLPIARDVTAWPAPVLAAVIRGAPRPRAATVEDTVDAP